jgi:hypothetical protein
VRRGRVSVGTIVLALRRPAFAVIAADRRFTVDDGSHGEHPKVVMHATLPFACATGGIAHFAGLATTEHIQNILDGFHGNGGVPTFSEVAMRFSHHFAPLLAPFLQSPPPGVDLVRIRLEVAMARVEAGVAEIADYVLTDQPNVSLGSQGFIRPPAGLATFYTPPAWTAAQLRGSPTATAPELALHARNVLEAGIAADAEAHNGQNAECGGGVDVVVVNGTGASAA